MMIGADVHSAKRMILPDCDLTFLVLAPAGEICYLSITLV